MYLKNFSWITRDGITTLTPAYDLLNSTIAMQGASEEIALPLNGKKSNLQKNDLFDYFAKERLQLNQTIIRSVIHEIQQAIPEWRRLIDISFLSTEMKEKYLNLLNKRCTRLNLS